MNESDHHFSLKNRLFCVLFKKCRVSGADIVPECHDECLLVTILTAGILQSYCFSQGTELADSGSVSALVKIFE